MINRVAMQAYNNALEQSREFSNTVKQATSKPEPKTSFNETLMGSLDKVNEMQGEKARMIEEFASGKNQNVHELMITMQKAGLAMQVTSTVRSKVMQTYQEVMRMQF